MTSGKSEGNPIDCRPAYLSNDDAWLYNLPPLSCIWTQIQTITNNTNNNNNNHHHHHNNNNNNEVGSSRLEVID